MEKTDTGIARLPHLESPTEEYEKASLPKWPNEHQVSDKGSDKPLPSDPQAVQEYPSTLRLTIIVTILSLSAILSGLDQTILATAAPKITNDFHALDDIAWWTSVYLLTSATFQLVFGRCNTIFSVKYVYITANAIFALGSLICTVARNSTTLIIGRAIAGIGVAGIMSGNVLIIAASAPLERRPFILGFLFTWLGIASMIGPFIGGALTDDATWRWCFGINLPIGALIILSAFVFVKTPLDPAVQKLSKREKIKRFDIGGTTLLTASFFCLIFALQLGGSKTWSDHRVIALFVVFGVLLLAFLALKFLFESNGLEPAMKNHNIWLTATYAGCVSAGLFIQITYMPVWFQAVRGATALRSGVMVTPLIASFVVMSTLSGMFTEMIGYYNPAMVFGSLLSAIGAGFLTTLSPSTASPAWIGFQALYGLGAGASVPPPMLVVQTVLDKDHIPMGVAFVSLLQMMWAALIIAIAQPIFESKLRDRMSTILPDLDAESLFRIGAWDLKNAYPQDLLPQITDAYSNAVVKVFFITAALSALAFPCAIFIKWQCMKKPKKVDASEE